MTRRAAVYSASRTARPMPAAKRTMPLAAAAPKAAPGKPVAKPKPRRWVLSPKARFAAAAAALVLAFGALWLSRPAITQQQVEALVHRAIADIQPAPTAT